MFRVRVHRRAAQALDDLPAAARRRVLDLLLVFKDDPAPVDRFDVKRIRGASSWFRVRVGGLQRRLLGGRGGPVVTVERITPRGDAYGG